MKKFLGLISLVVLSSVTINAANAGGLISVGQCYIAQKHLVDSAKMDGDELEVLRLQKLKCVKESDRRMIQEADCTAKRIDGRLNSADAVFCE